MYPICRRPESSRHWQRPHRIWSTSLHKPGWWLLWERWPAGQSRPSRPPERPADEILGVRTRAHVVSTLWHDRPPRRASLHSAAQRPSEQTVGSGRARRISPPPPPAVEQRPTGAAPIQRGERIV